MTIDTSSTELRDITLAFEQINASGVNIRKLKTLFDMQPVVVETPDLSMIMYPPHQLIIQITDNRIRISHQKVLSNIDELPLWDIADTCRKLVANQHLTGYGFNYNIISEIDLALHQAVINKWFLPNSEAVSNVLQGQIVTFTPRIVFERDAKLYDLIMEQATSKHLRAHLNVHFDEKRLPGRAKLKANFIKEYEDFRMLLSRLYDPQ